MTQGAGPPLVFDRFTIRRRRDRSAATVETPFLFAEVAARLTDRLADVARRFELALDLGARDGALAEAALTSGRVGHLVAADLSDRLLARCAGRCVATNCVVADEEFLPFGAGTFDLVLSALSLHSTNDLPGALLQINRALKPDGLLLAAMFGSETLTELRHAFLAAEVAIEGGASPRVAPFASMADAGALLQRAGFALPVVDNDIITVNYETPWKLLADLRAMGETNALVARRRVPLRRTTLTRMVEAYSDLFSAPGGRIRATFEVIYLSGWRPHPSQQQPLKPGSTAERLAEALGSIEQPAGDKARP
ncbi:MAG: methyltransferase domain-containing protein [Alphaproteobacteria bacterium]|nr:methyltransferase domain-containing protein [Alphaproteobacteria bacterium]